MIYMCEINLTTHKIEYYECGEDDDEPDYVEYDQQFNKVYGESAASKEAAFLLVQSEVSRIYSKMYNALLSLEKHHDRS